MQRDNLGLSGLQWFQLSISRASRWLCNNLACPFCMGYNFASEEWEIIQSQDNLSSQSRGIKKSKPSSEAESRMLEQEFQSVKAEYHWIDVSKYAVSC